MQFISRSLYKIVCNITTQIWVRHRLSNFDSGFRSSLAALIFPFFLFFFCVLWFLFVLFLFPLYTSCLLPAAVAVWIPCKQSVVSSRSSAHKEARPFCFFRSFSNSAFQRTLSTVSVKFESSLTLFVDVVDALFFRGSKSQFVSRDTYVGKMTVAMQRRGALNSVRLPEMWTFGKILVIFLMFGTGDCADLKSTAAASATSVLRHRHFGKYFALTIFFLVLGIVAAFVIYGESVVVFFLVESSTLLQEKKLAGVCSLLLRPFRRGLRLHLADSPAADFAYISFCCRKTPARGTPKTASNARKSLLQLGHFLKKVLRPATQSAASLAAVDGHSSFRIPAGLRHRATVVAMRTTTSSRQFSCVTQL